MFCKTRATAALLIGSSVALVAPLQAQEAEAPNATKTDTSKATANAKANQIVVTGTRIRGAKVASEAITIDRQSIVDIGQIDLGEALRALPQNFAGGQNPGVGSGAGLINQNINGASSPNLRGLGPDATLTLLNGHRLPYDSAFQGVDISAIPLAAIDRVEIVPDGASALYGSDAVGGVVNVILRRDFDGIETSAQLGSSTEGGDFRQQADLVGGARWNGGGFVTAYNYVHNSQIAASQRSFAASLYPETSLYPGMRQHAVTFSVHQDILPGVEASLDALYSNRTSSRTTGTASLDTFRAPKLETYTLAPSFKVALGGGWQASLAGAFGRDRTRLYTRFTPATGTPTVSGGHYFNEVTSLELGAEGPLFALPGGSARLALGGGLRTNRLDYAVDDGVFNSSFVVRRRERFAYAELYLPFVAPANRIDGINTFSLSTAVRYEDYPGLDQLATPRIGVTYAPTDSLTLTASWARSFKAPTLYQQYTFYEAILLPAAVFSAGNGSDTVLYAAGGNTALRPETARSWTVGFDFKPTRLPGFEVSATYFDIAYDNRVVSPISGSLSAAFANPGYASLIDHSPDPASLAALVAGAQFGLENYSGGTYDPASVVAVIDNRNINVASWSVRGVDARISWQRELGQERSFNLALAGSWLDSNQRVTPELPQVQLSGSVFNPPRYRLRASAGVQMGAFSANAAVNCIGALVDRRSGQTQRLSPSATFDLALHYALIRGRSRDPRLALSLSVQNLFDRQPETIGQTGPTDTPYDSTNYSAVGRFVAFGIKRRW